MGDYTTLRMPALWNSIDQEASSTGLRLQVGTHLEDLHFSVHPWDKLTGIQKLCTGLLYSDPRSADVETESLRNPAARTFENTGAQMSAAGREHFSTPLSQRWGTILWVKHLLLNEWGL